MMPIPSRIFSRSSLLSAISILAVSAFVINAKDKPSFSNSCLSESNYKETKSAMPKIPTPVWFQHEISITAPSRGCHLVTSKINDAIKNDIRNIKIGMANLFIQHTSASLTINENADPDVRRDMEVAMNRISEFFKGLWHIHNYL